MANLQTISRQFQDQRGFFDRKKHEWKDPGVRRLQWTWDIVMILIWAVSKKTAGSWLMIIGGYTILKSDKEWGFSSYPFTLLIAHLNTLLRRPQDSESSEWPFHKSMMNMWGHFLSDMCSIRSCDFPMFRRWFSIEIEMPWSVCGPLSQKGSWGSLMIPQPYLAMILPVKSSFCCDTVKLLCTWDWCGGILVPEPPTRKSFPFLAIPKRDEEGISCENQITCLYLFQAPGFIGQFG